MIGRGIGSGFAAARDFLARGLVRARVHPNALTVFGTLLTLAAACCFAAGAGDRFAWRLAGGGGSAWNLLAAALLVLASACDMLDGAVARLGGKKTSFGAFLDSTLDRVSDFAVYAGIAAYYAWQSPGNVTFVLLSLLSFSNGYLISYTRARAEDMIRHCTVGYWQRGERSAAVLIATFAGNIPALLIQQAFLPMLTIVRRVAHTRAVMAGREQTADSRQGGLWQKLRLWRRPRGTWGYDLVTGINIAWLIFARLPARDVLREWLG